MRLTFCIPIVFAAFSALLIAACAEPVPSFDRASPDAKESDESNATKKNRRGDSKDKAASEDNPIFGDEGDGDPGNDAPPDESSSSSSGGTLPEEEPKSTGSCAIDEDCILGEICTNKVCRPGCHTTFDCPLTDECVAGMCRLETPPSPPPPSSSSSSSGTSETCTSDGQCNPGINGTGRICTANRCVAGCRQTNQCPGLMTCVDGQCR